MGFVRWSDGGSSSPEDGMATESLIRRRERSIKRLRERRYDGFSMVLHWLTALVVLVQVSIGLTMVALPAGAAQNALFYTHKSLGVTLLLLVLLRLLWRIARPWPPLPAEVPALQATVARINHALLYVTLLVMAISGLVFTASGGYPVPVFGIVDLTGMIAKNPALSERVETVHLATQWVLYALVGLHVLGAFYHLLVRKDGVFQRMLPR
jgi:cytochrome b561